MLFRSTGPLLLGIAGLGLAAGALVREARGRFADPANAVLLAITAFVLASAALTAMGRLNFGVDQAHASRYLTPGGVFWAAQVVYWARALTVCPARVRGGGAVLLTVLFALLIWNQARQGPIVDQHAIGIDACVVGGLHCGTDVDVLQVHQTVRKVYVIDSRSGGPAAPACCSNASSSAPSWASRSSPW